MDTKTITAGRAEPGVCTDASAVVATINEEIT